MTKPRLSMKLLWQIAHEFKGEPLVQNVPQFLNFVEIYRNREAGKYIVTDPPTIKEKE